MPAKGGHSVLRPATRSRLSQGVNGCSQVKAQFTWSVTGLEGVIYLGLYLSKQTMRLTGVNATLCKLTLLVAIWFIWLVTMANYLLVS